MREKGDASMGWLPGLHDGLLDSPRQSRSRRTTRQIVEAAADVLAAEGIDGFTMAGVSRRAGVSIGGIYGRFDGKAGLLRAVKEMRLQRLEGDLAGRYQPSTGSLVDVVTNLVDALATPARCGAFFPLSGFPDGDEQLADPEQRARQRLLHLFKDAALPHMREISHREPELALNVIFQLIVAGLATHACFRVDEDDHIACRDRFGRELVRVSLAYLQGDVPKG